MQWRRMIVTLSVLLVLVGSAFTPAYGQTELTKTLPYWDMGLSIKYPDTWAEPQFIPGQLTLSPLSPNEATIFEQPTVAFRVVDPLVELSLPKDAPLAQIA